MNEQTTYPPLSAYCVIYDNGDREEVSMAAGVTLEQARAYYVGRRFEITETTFHTAVAVRPAYRSADYAILVSCMAEAKRLSGQYGLPSFVYQTSADNYAFRFISEDSSLGVLIARFDATGKSI